MSNRVPLSANELLEKIGNFAASYKLILQYVMGMMTYRYKLKPTAAFARAKKGTPSGLPRNAEIVAQSRENEPMPKPLSPDPICWAVTDVGHKIHATEMVVKEVKKYPGRM